MKINTKIVHNSLVDPQTGSISQPIYQVATFAHPKFSQSTGYDYSRLANPTRTSLEEAIACLENGKFGFAFSSGMAAISTVLTLFTSNDHIILSDDLYGGTFRICDDIYKRYGLEFDYVDTSDLELIKAKIKPNTKAIFIETPSNPMMKVADIELIKKINTDLLLIVDNTFLSPYFQKPLDLNADIVLHSGTKFLCGHNDTLSGFVVVNDEDIAAKLKNIQVSVGATLSPMDCWLMLRGMKTLSVRLERQQENAIKIANWMKTKKEITDVYYVGLKEHDGYDVNNKQASGFGSMISFRVSDPRLVEQILNNLKIILFAESLGGVESLMTYPLIQTHAAIPVEMKEKLGIDETLLRFSVGIEDCEDLITDLNNAIDEGVKTLGL